MFFIFKVDKQAVASRLKQIREARKLSTTDVAKNTGLSSGNLSSWENGKFLPGAEALALLSEEYNVTIDWILKGDDALIIEMPLITNKVEAVIDPDLNEMIELLQDAMLSGDADLRGWTKIQFKNAFKDFSNMKEEQKKLHA